MGARRSCTTPSGPGKATASAVAGRIKNRLAEKAPSTVNNVLCAVNNVLCVLGKMLWVAVEWEVITAMP